MLEHIFTLQERVLKKNVVEYKTRYDFISECVDLIGSPKFPVEIWKVLPLSHRVIFNYFHGDALSTLINAIRLCLQGCETDAYALMRVVLENLTIFQYVVKFGIFDEAYSELGKAKRGERFSKKLSYKTAITKLGIKDRRERLKGELSTLGSHLSSNRLTMSRFQIGDTDFPKIGASINNPEVKKTLDELASMALFFVQIMDDFFITTKIGDTFHNRRIELETLYEKSKTRG